jgi:hypothetical protein
MQNTFNTAAAESFLTRENLQYRKNPDGTLLVQGNIELARRGLHALPDLSCVIVTGNFYCQDNNLTSLKGAPKEVRGGFWCNGNRLETLEHTPAGITGQFVCSNNRLASLTFAPEKITGDFACGKNPLASLEGAPKEFNKLYSDFGDFKSWEEVPEQAKFSAETRASRAEAMGRDAITLRRDMRILKPLSLKKPG